MIIIIIKIVHESTDWIFIIYIVICSKLKVLAYMCINHNGDGAD